MESVVDRPGNAGRCSMCGKRVEKAEMCEMSCVSAPSDKKLLVEKVVRCDV